MKARLIDLATSLLTLAFTMLFGISRLLKLKSWARIARRARWRACLGAMGRTSDIAASAVIQSPFQVSIGERSTIGDFVHVWGGGEVVVGNDVLVASHCAITSLTHSSDAVVFRESLVRGRVVIEDNVWIGSGATILPGVTLGRGCIVGAGAVVTRDVAAGATVVGVPARSVPTRSSQA